jgi:hypothetical protein
MPFLDDLYKSLVDESKTYREKVSTIWLQKFTMLGAIIAFAATRTETTSKNPDLIAAAILSLPLIAVLLDVKLAEFGIHARVIDDFIIRNSLSHAYLAIGNTRNGAIPTLLIEVWFYVVRSPLLRLLPFRRA